LWLSAAHDLQQTSEEAMYSMLEWEKKKRRNLGSQGGWSMAGRSSMGRRQARPERWMCVWAFSSYLGEHAWGREGRDRQGPPE
jgi:hypothetical protein